MGGRACYGRPPIAALPPLSCWPLEDQRVRVSVMLEREPAVFSWYETEVAGVDLHGLLARYAEDPEQLLFDLFGYTVREQYGRPTGPLEASGVAVSATDLDF